MSKLELTKLTGQPVLAAICNDLKAGFAMDLPMIEAPKVGGVYFIPSLPDSVEAVTWTECPTDYKYLKAGMAFDSENAAYSWLEFNEKIVNFFGSVK